MGTHRWSEMSPSARATVVVLAIIQFSLLAAALRDLRRRPAAQVRGGKGRWAAISLINFVGPIAYFVAGRRRG